MCYDIGRPTEQLSHLTNNGPAVRTIPRTAQETLSLNGISGSHCWKSSDILSSLAFWGSSDCEIIQESAIFAKTCFTNIARCFFYVRVHAIRIFNSETCRTAELSAIGGPFGSSTTNKTRLLHMVLEPRKGFSSGKLI